MVIRRCQIRRVWWVWIYIQSKLQKFLAIDQTCLWSGIVLVEYNTFPILQLWLLLFDGNIQFVQLTTVHIRIDGLVDQQQLEKYNSLSIPPYREHHLLLMNTIGTQRTNQMLPLKRAPTASR